MTQIGMDDVPLAAANNRLIRVSNTGYGQDPPYADMRAYDMLMQAESGLCTMTGA